MEIKVKKVYENEKGEEVLKVKINEESFKEVKPFKKCNKRGKIECKYWKECSAFDGCILRRFDCVKNKKIAINLYIFITTLLLGILLYHVFFVKHLKLLKGIGIMIIGIVILDIICCLIEKNVPKIRNKHFYNKLKRRKQKAEIKKEKEEKEKEKKEAEETFEKMSQMPYYNDVMKAETFGKSLKKLSSDYNFGENDKKIDLCADKILEIVDILKKDSSGYPRVAFLFEGSLEEFYNTLKLYTHFLEADIHEEENEKVLSECVDAFLRYLGNQKIEAIFDKSSIEVQFRSSAKALKTIVEKNWRR